MKYVYYLLRRPAMPGTCPKGFVELENFDRRTYVPEIGRDAWARLVYENKLDEREIRNYEMMEVNYE